MRQVISFSVVTLVCAFATFAQDEERLSPNLSAAPAPLGDRFVGREAEFAKLDTAWTAGKTRMIGVVAWGGFGKSAMVRQWLYRHEKGWPEGAEPEGIFWYTVRPKTDARFLYTEVMNYFYRSGQQLAGEDAPIDEKLAALKFAIGDRRAIIVLDGLEPLQVADANDSNGSAADPLLRELLRAFCRGDLGNVMCVVTSRLPLTDVAEFEGKTCVQFNLEERLLTEDEAKLLLRLEGVKAGSDEQKKRLIAFCHHHPLALKLAANLLKVKAGGDAGKWAQFAGIRNTDLAEQPEAARESVRIVLHILRQHLSSEQVAAIELLARLPRPLPADSLGLLAEDEWPQQAFDARQFDATLVSLVELRVVDYNEATREFALHPLVAEYFSGRPGKNWIETMTDETLPDIVQKLVDEKPDVRAALDQLSRLHLSATDALDISQEPAHIRELYGIDVHDSPWDGPMNERAETRSFGLNCLVARRLLERGVRFVQDLKQQGLLDDTIVHWTTEFGRMPCSQGAMGRDHNPDAFTNWFAGGGIRGGTTYGPSDEWSWRSADPDNPTFCYDAHATMLHLLGIDHTKLTVQHNSIDRRLTDVHGHVIREIIA